MTPLDLITRRQYLEEELVLAAATHQYVLDGPSPTTRRRATPATPSSTACGPAGPTRSTA